MAATVSSVWAKPGAWALDSEENEEELSRGVTHHQPPPPADFPSLSAAASKPKKKNKAQPISLAAFANYSAAPKAATFQPKRHTQEEVISLPTGPREWTAEELDRTRLGGGFRNYGGGGADSRVRVSDRNREGYEGNSNRERDMGSSRADEVDDWSKGKKVGSFSGGSGPERRESGGFFNSSRADEVDNWGSNKSFVPRPEAEPRRERRMGFDSYSNGSGPDADTWGRKREERAVEPENWGRKKEDERESSNPSGVVGRPRLNLQPRTMPVSNNGQSVTPTEGGKPKASNPFGEARPREEVLAEKGKDWKEIDEKLEPVSNNGQSLTPTEGGKPKASNPFGEARPREEVLAEKGKDWKEIDEKLEAVKIKEVEGETGEAFGRRKGFGIANDDRTIKSWRKHVPNDIVSSPPSEENNQNIAQVTEKSDSMEKEQEEN